MKSFGWIFISWVLLFGLLAESKENETYSAGELVELAVRRNPELRALEHESGSLEYAVDQASRWSNPNLELGGSRKVEIGGDTGFAKVGVSQLVERPARLRARIAVAKSRAAMAETIRVQSELELRARVLELIYEHKVAREKANHARERLGRFRTVNAFLRSRVFASPQKNAEAVIVRTKLLVLRKSLRELETHRITAWNRLNLYLTLGAEPTVKAPWYGATTSYDLDTLRGELEKANPELRKQSAKVSESQSELNLVTSDYWPGLTVSGSYEIGTGSHPERMYGLGLSIPLPIFDAKGAAIRSQQRRVDADQERRKWVLASATDGLRSAFERYKAAQASLSDLGIGKIPNLERDMDVIDRNFKTGQVDLLTYIEADAEHFETLNAILDSQNDFVDAQNSLLLLVGRTPRAQE